MASSAVMKLALVALMCIVVAVPVAEAIITCGQVTQNMEPCISYISTGGAVPEACCNGIRSLNSMVKTTTDRKQTCTCLKNVAGSIPGLNPTFAADLPSNCGVSIPYEISTSINCNDVK